MKIEIEINEASIARIAREAFSTDYKFTERVREEAKRQLESVDVAAIVVSAIKECAEEEVSRVVREALEVMTSKRLKLALRVATKGQEELL